MDPCRCSISKCKVVIISRKRNTGKTNYQMMGTPLKEVKESQYLGIKNQNNLKWDLQSSIDAGKGSRMLNFLQRNFHTCCRAVKENLTRPLYRPIFSTQIHHGTQEPRRIGFEPPTKGTKKSCKVCPWRLQIPNQCHGNAQHTQVGRHRE